MVQESYLITKNTTFYYNKHLKELKSAKYYTVRKGDTLGRIASRNGTSVNSICRLNKISSKTLIRPGQKLRVR
jgi:LysM repeat protein